MGRAAAFIAGVSFVGLMAGQALASETATYTYDTLGRLIATSRSGGPNNALQSTLGFDAAGNRTSYTVAGGNTNPPSFSIGNATATEGGNLVFPVTRSGNTSAAVSVNYSTANGTAIAGSDYTAASGTLSFAAGQTTGTITVPTIDDSTPESTETMTVTLSSPSSGAAISTAVGTGSIADNDAATPPVAVNDTTTFVCTTTKLLNVVANDSDPNGHTPLTLESVTSPYTAAWASVANTTSISISASSPGTYSFQYVISNSIGGTASATVTATITGKAGICTGEPPA